MERKGLEWARGRSVILLKVSVSNQVIFISLFVVGAHSFGLQRQVRKKRCFEWEVAGSRRLIYNVLRGL